MNTDVLRRTPFLLLLLILFNTSLAAAQNEDASSSDKRVIDYWLNVAQDYAKSYEIFATDRPEEKFKLVEEPVFRHTQSVRGDDIGALYLWVDETRRPVAIGVVFSFSNSETARTAHNEFHSLYPAPISSKFRDSDLWESQTPGLIWQSFPDFAKTPADSHRRRLLEMRELARQFSGHTIDFQGKRWELRQVATPIYEYDVAATDGDNSDREELSGTIGGALFAFCQGTDTEILLLIEAKQLDGKQVYQFAYAPFTDYGLTLQLDGKPVEEAPKGLFGENGNPHFWKSIESVPKPEFEMNR